MAFDRSHDRPVGRMPHSQPPLHVPRSAALNCSARRLLLLLALAGLSTHVLPAAVISWSNTATDWATGTNWTGSVAPADDLTTDIANFATATPTFQPNLGASRSVGGIRFSNGAGAFTLSGTGSPTLTLGASGISQQDNTAQTIAASLSLALGAAASFQTTSTGALTISSAVNNAGFLLTLGATSTGAGTISGIISGAGGLTKSGSNTWTLSGANTFTGPVIISAGTLSINSLGNVSGAASALGTPTTVGDGTIKLGSGATTATLNYTGTGHTSDRVVDLAGTTGGAILNASGASGALVLTSNLTATGSGAKTLTLGGTGTGANTIQGLIVDSGGGATALTKTGAGNWVLTAANTYTGATAISGGGLHLSGSGAISSANLNLSGGGVLGLSGTFSRALGTGASQVRFTGTGGGFAAYGGALSVGFAGGEIWGTTTNFLPAAGTLTLASSLANDIVTWTTDFSLGAANRAVAVANGTAATDAIISAVISGTGGLNKSGAGTLALTGANTFSGQLHVQAGIVTVASLGNGGDSGPVGTHGTLKLGNTTTAGILIYTGAGETSNRVIDLAGTTGGATLQHDGSGALILSANPTVTGAGVKILTLAGTSTAANELQGVIANGASNTALTKSGTGTWRLSGVNTYAGATTVSAGTLVATNSASFGTGTLALAGGTVQGDGSPLTFTNALTISANSILGGASDLTFSGNFNLGTTTRTLTVSNTGATTFSGILSNTAGFTKAGAGTLTLSGSNTYSGTTSLTAGTLVVGHNSALGTGTLALGGGTLAGDGTAHTLTNTRTQSATATIGGTSDLTLSGTQTNSNTVTLNIANTALTTLGAINLSNSATNRTLTLNTTGGDVTITGVIANGGTSTASALTKAGAGTLILDNANTYGGATTITGGTLRLGPAGALPNTAVSLNATGTSVAATLDLNGYSDAIGSLTLGGTTTTSAAHVSTGLGTLTLGGNVTYTATGNPLGSTLSGNLALGATTRTFTVNNSTTAATDLTVSALISSTGGGLTKTGTGVLLLSGANTYDAVTTVSAGILEFSTIGTVGGGASNLGTPTTVGNGTIALGAATLRYTGTGHTTDRIVNLTGAGIITANGAGTLAFDVASGSAVTGTNLGLTLNGTGTGAILDPIATGTGSLTKSGTGTWTLAGANTYTGATAVSAGVLNLQNSTATGTTAGGVTVTSGAAVELQGGIAVGAESLSLAGTGIATTGALRNLSGANSWGGALALTAASKIQSDASSLTLTGNISGATFGLTFDGAGDLTATGIIGTTTGTLTKSGAGTTTLSGLNTFTGATTIQAGTVSINSLANLSTSSALGAPTTAGNGTIALGSTTNAATLRYTGSGHSSNRVVNLAGTTGGATLDASGAGALTLTAALTATGAGSKTLTLTGTSTAANTLSGAIVDNSGVNLTALAKTGTGTWDLGGTSTFTGGVTVSDGTLTVKSGASLAAANDLTLSGGTLNLDHATQTVASLAGSGGTINFGTGHILTLAQITATSYAGVLAGSGGFTLSGSGGSLTLSGGSANTHAGNTTINEGTLILAKTPGTAAIAGGTITVGNGAGTDILRLGASHQIGNSTNLTLAGGSFQLNNFSETLAALKLDASSTIDFGSTASALVFADSSAQSWTGTLTIANYTTASGNSLRFGTTASGLTSGQLAQISFTGYGAGVTIDGSGYVSPIPEPGTYAVLAGLAALALAARRRRRS
jgi:fibronectin-binding autotransporter adhesin